MFDDFDVVDEYCGFEQSDLDAWEDQQVFLDNEHEADLWDDAEADGFFDNDHFEE